MKILLTTLNSKYVHSNLALKYLYGTAKEICQNLEIREFTINNSRDYIHTELALGEYDLVCFSCYIWNIEQTLELTENLKKAQPGIMLAFGGPEVSYDSEELFQKHSFLDFLMVGEGEKTFRLLCEALNGNLEYRQVPGLIYRRDDHIEINESVPLLPLEEVPFPYEAFPCEDDKVVYYESARGCPYNCSYCISSLDKGMRVLPLERVKDELGHFVRCKVQQVKLLDRTFNWDKERSLEIFRFLMEIDLGVTNFHFEICADLLDDHVLAVLSQARKGLFQFEVGIQSINEQTLTAINRTANTAKLLQNVRRLVELGNSRIHVDLIAGLPHEDYTSFRRSFDVVYALGAENLQLGFLKLLKGTAIRDQEAEHRYEYMSKAPYEVISNRFMSAEELCWLKQIEMVLDLYHNRGGFEKTLAHLIGSDSPFDFYQDFAKHYYTGYQHRSHKKEDLYRILYEYTGDDARTLEMLEADLERTMNFDAVKKFKRKGWNIRG